MEQTSTSTSTDGMDEDKGDGDGDDGDCRVDFSVMLRELLEEAQGMPIHMDEVQVLRGHVQALEWAAKARKTLPLSLAPALASSLAAIVGEPGKINSKAENNASFSSSSSSDNLLGVSQSLAISPKPTLAKIHELANEIKR